MRKVEAHAKTREEAIQNALKQLGVEMYEVDHIEILDEGSGGFLGFGARPVRVRLTVENLPDEPAPSTQRAEPRREERGPSREQNRDQNRGRGRDQGRGRGDRPERGRQGGERRPDTRPPQGEAKTQGEARTQEPKKEQQGRPQRPPRPQGAQRPERAPDRKPTERREGPREARRDERRPERPARGPRTPDTHKRAPEPAKRETPRPSEEDDFEEIIEADNGVEVTAAEEEAVTAITDEQGQEAAALLQEMISKMGIESKAIFDRPENGGARVSVESEDGAILIGRKGRNLSAMQYLINRMISRADQAENTERLVVDVEGYVDRRRETLEDIALSLAKRAKETGRNMRLKPLSPQERRIIHVTLQNDPEVRTYSLGSSLFRSVIISPKEGQPERQRPQRPANRSGRPRYGRGGGGGRRRPDDNYDAGPLSD